jgi:transposase InsO family protein
VLPRNGIGRLGRLGLEPAVRYERLRPGELVYIDIKKLGRIEGGAGKRVSGRSGGAYRPRRSDLHGSRRGTIGWEFVHIERILTDDGSAYISTIHALACDGSVIRHLRTRPRRPQTNGKAERFIRTMLQGWAYGAIYRSSHERTQALDGWLWHDNHRRRHSALGHQPPASRTNLLRSYS